MGIYVGRVIKLPRGSDLGLVRSNVVEGLDTPFDVATMTRAEAQGPGRVHVGAIVHYSIRNGKASGMRTTMNRSQAMMFQSTKGRGSRATGLVHR